MKASSQRILLVQWGNYPVMKRKKTRSKESLLTTNLRLKTSQYSRRVEAGEEGPQDDIVSVATREEIADVGSTEPDTPEIEDEGLQRGHDCC